MAEKGERGERGPQGDVGSVNGNYPDGTPTWLKILLVSLQRFGIATVILLVGGWWLATRIAEPLMTTYTKSIELQTKILGEQADTIADMKKLLESRTAFFSDAKSSMSSFAADSRKEHLMFLQAQEQALRDHKEFMERLKSPHN